MSARAPGRSSATTPVPVSPARVLPDDAADAVLVGRVWDPEAGGPRPVRVAGEEVIDLFPLVTTVSELLEREDAAALVATAHGPVRWDLASLIDASLERRADRPHLLAPIDLQAVKACGVTFVDSLIERVIEERSGGDVARAAELRDKLAAVIRAGVGTVEPGSAAAEEVRRVFLAEGLWSQYMEVALGPDPEVFTKAPVLASVGFGAQVGIPAFSTWNNPEPELVLAVDARGRARGCMLGNDVNLRDVEGRSALLLGMAKDNTASSALGPFLRLFEDAFTIDDVRQERITLRVDGAVDGYVLEGESNVAQLSRSFESLIDATFGDHHQYPDGFALYTGTLFAPTADRDQAGAGFTHKHGDWVSIASPHLGALINEVAPTEELPRWTFGIRSLIGHLQRARSEAPYA